MTRIHYGEEFTKVDCESISHCELLSESKATTKKYAESDKYFFHRSIVYTWFGISKFREVSFFLFALQSRYDLCFLLYSFYRRISSWFLDSQDSHSTLMVKNHLQYSEKVKPCSFCLRYFICNNGCLLSHPISFGISRIYGI